MRIKREQQEQQLEAIEKCCKEKCIKLPVFYICLFYAFVNIIHSVTAYMEITK